MLYLDELKYNLKFNYWFFRSYFYFKSYSKKNKRNQIKIRDKKLRKKIQYAVNKSAYYKKIYKHIDIQNIKLEDLPVINKMDLVNNFNDFITIPSIRHDRLREYFMEEFSFDKMFLNEFLAFHTSGSTGNPAYVVWGAKEFATSTYMLLHKNIGLIKGSNIFEILKNKRKLLYFGIMDDYVGGNSWIYQIGKYVDVKMISIFSSPDQWIKIINEFQPDVIMAKPHVLAKLANQVAGGSLHISPEKLIFVGEMLRPRDKEVIHKYFSCPLMNSYSTCETGPVAWQTDEREKLSVINEEVIVELLDDDNKPIREFYKEGKVVITNLYSKIMPIIRYEIGDRAYFIPNEINDEMSTISYIKGRNTSNFIFENALGSKEIVSEYPFWSLDIPSIARYQVVQKSLTELLIKIELEKNNSYQKDLILEKFYSKVRRIFGERENLHNITIRFEMVDRILPSKSGKIKITIPLNYEEIKEAK